MMTKNQTSLEPSQRQRRVGEEVRKILSPIWGFHYGD